MMARLTAYWLAALTGAMFMTIPIAVVDIGGASLGLAGAILAVMSVAVALMDLCTRSITYERRIIWPLVVALPLSLAIVSWLIGTYGRDFDARATIVVGLFFWALFAAEWIVLTVVMMQLSARGSAQHGVQQVSKGRSR